MQGELEFGKSRFFVDRRSGLLEAAYKEKLGEGPGVVFSSLCRKPKEKEEDESANDG